MARELSFSKRSRSVNIKLPKAGRSVLLMLIVTFFLNVFVFRLIQLQIFEGQYNRTRAEENRIRPVGMVAERGNILDRKGKLLAANRLTRSVYLWPKEQKPEDWRITAHRLSQVLNIPASEILQKLEKIGYNSALPVRISRDINPQAFTVLAEKAQEFKGIEISSCIGIHWRSHHRRHGKTSRIPNGNDCRANGNRTQSQRQTGGSLGKPAN
jgi:penicillin-binding protein 2